MEMQSVEVPARLKLYEWVTTPPFEASQEYKVAMERGKKEAKNTKILNLVLWIILVAVVVYLYTTGKTYLPIAIIGGIILGIISIKSMGGASSDKYLPEAAVKHGKILIDELVSKYFAGFATLRYETDALIYNNDVFACVSTKTGLFVIITTGEIKSINVREGLSNKRGDVYDYTVSPSGSIGIKYLGNQQLPDMRMEIVTSFMGCPIINLTFGQPKDYANEIKKACAIMT